MKSLLKSYNAGNCQFYENLHRKYFDKAKEGGDGAAQKKRKKRQEEEQDVEDHPRIDEGVKEKKSGVEGIGALGSGTLDMPEIADETNLFDLTSNTNTMLMSQLNYTGNARDGNNQSRD